MSLFACELSFAERYRLAWEIAWPTIAIDIGWAIIAFGLLNLQGQSPMLAHELVSLFVVAPWVVRRMVRQRYPRFRLKTLFADGEGQMGYTESFKVMWLLSWRTTALAIFLLLPVVAAVVGITGIDLKQLAPSAGSQLADQIGMSLVLNAASFVLLPLVVPGMLSKRYQGFRVVTERPPIAPAMPAPARGRK